MNVVKIDWYLLWLRLVFAATLLLFFLSSALTKFGDGFAGLWTPSVGAYAQIFPLKMESVGFDPSAMSSINTLIALGAAYGEIILPLAVVLGLFTRISAAGMIIFIIVMSFVDVTGHGVTDGGRLFDKLPYGIIADSRLYWITLLIALCLFGGGRYSIDGQLKRFGFSRSD